jgi:hypothetical protein
MDQQIDNFLRWTKMFCLQWGLFLFNYVTNTWDAGCEWCVRSLRAIEHAHKEDMYIFLSRNTHPVHVKGDWAGLRDNSFVFSTETNRFTRQNRIQPQQNHRFDVVTVGLDTNGGEMFDLSPLFMDVSWKDQAAPSPYEMVLLWAIMSNKSYSLQELDSFHLTVMDSDANDHRLSLQNEIVRRPFTGWT